MNIYLYDKIMIRLEMSKTQGLKTKYIAYGIKIKPECTAKQALNKMFKTYLEILSFSS